MKNVKPTIEQTVTMTKYWLGKPEEVQVTKEKFVETWTTAVSEKGYSRIVDYSDYDIRDAQLKKIEDFKDFMAQLAAEQWERDYEEQNPVNEAQAS
jgi:hypothetical protein|tara:strand:+ start:73 stop:360 length:288 start_codon:yes stop_codon:yes gene_type:complete